MKYFVMLSDAKCLAVLETDIVLDRFDHIWVSVGMGPERAVVQLSTVLSSDALFSMPKAKFLDFE